MKSVFLDFDGVLFDTLKEAYIICRSVYYGTDYLTGIDKDEYDLFYKYKFLVYNSWQYYYIMTLLRGGYSDSEFINRYMECLNNRDVKSEEEFDKKYYSTRKDLMINYHEFWDKLESPFPFFHQIKSLYEGGDIDIVIVSKKNRAAIKYRFQQNGLILSDEKIYGKDELSEFDTKVEFIRKYMSDNNIERTFFIDDNSNNLNPCKSDTKITPLLAGWGNTAIGEKGLSADNIIDSIQSGGVFI